MKYLFTEENLGVALLNCDWDYIAKVMYGYSSSAYFDCNLELKFAETMCDVNGLMIVSTVDLDNFLPADDASFFFINSWVDIVSPATSNKIRDSFNKLYDL